MHTGLPPIYFLIKLKPLPKIDIVLNRRLTCHPSNSMPNEHIIALLITERAKLNRAIEALQGSAKRRGRPPKHPTAAAATPIIPIAPKKTRKPSAAQRKAQAERMKAYWAAKRKSSKA